jgi:hypothetical protein
MSVRKKAARLRANRDVAWIAFVVLVLFWIMARNAPWWWVAATAWWPS